MASTFPADKLDAITVSPHSGGQIVQYGRAVARSGSRYFVREVSRDRSESSTWKDDGQYSEHGRPLVFATMASAIQAAAY